MASLEKLESAGIKLDDMNEAQKKVLSELSDEEVDTMASVKERLEGAGGEVGGLAMSDGIFYH